VITLSRVLELNKLHVLNVSKDAKPLPFFLLCGICDPKSRLFDHPRALFYHLHAEHMEIKNGEFQDPESKPKRVYDKGFFNELKRLEQISYANQKGLLNKKNDSTYADQMEVFNKK